MKAVHRWWTIVIPFLVVVQITLVGVGAFHAAGATDDRFGGKAVAACDPSCGKSFNDGVSNWFGPHVAFGYLLVLSVLLYMLFSLATRERRLMKIGGIAAVLFVAQVLLAWIGDSAAWLGWLHPLNALLILGFTGRNAMVAWREREALKVSPAIQTA